MSIFSFRANRLTAAVVLAVFASIAQAAGTHGGTPTHGANETHGHGMGASIGEPGKPEQASRTIEIKMNDNYYEPESVRVTAGETVRFVIKNEGQLVHEFNIGTPDMHATHQKEMMMMMQHGALLPDRIDHERMKMDMGDGKTMTHDDPNSALIEPGKSAEVVWKFAKAGELEFACNVPGHYAAGMVGKIQTD